MTLKITPKILIIVAILVAVLVISVYAVTVLFTQTTTGPSITKPGSGAAISNCSSLTLPVSTIAATTSYQSGYWAATCSNLGPTANVTSTGTFLLSYSQPFVCCGASYFGVYLMNYTGTPNPTPSFCSGTNIGASGSPSIVLSKGAYYYCLSWSLNAYSANTPSSFPTVTVTWDSP